MIPVRTPGSWVCEYAEYRQRGLPSPLSPGHLCPLQPWHRWRGVLPLSVWRQETVGKCYLCAKYPCSFCRQPQTQQCPCDLAEPCHRLSLGAPALLFTVA